MSTVFATVLCLSSLIASCTPRDWSFVESVGGLAIEGASLNGSEWRLAVRVNVSGLERVTTRPTAVNSGLVCREMATRVRGSNIYLTVMVGVARDGYSVKCTEARLGPVKEGQYKIYYEDPNGELHSLGEIVLGSNNRVESLPSVARTALHGPNFVTTKSVPHKAAAHARRYASGSV